MSDELALYTKDQLIAELVNRRDGCPLVIAWTARDEDGDRIPMLAYSSSAIHEVMGLSEYASSRIQIGFTNAIAEAQQRIDDDEELT